jgi:predicted amidophosphoribosyltransferase
MSKLICNYCNSENPNNFRYCSSCGHELPIQKVEVNIEQPVKQYNAKKWDKKQLIGITVGVLAFFLSYYGVQQMFFKLPSFDKQMMEMASELNKNCPIMVDQETRWDNCIALPDNAFQYNY